MMSTEKELSDWSATADVQGANSFGAVDFMSGEGKQIDLQGVYVDGQFAGGLDGVGMEINVGFSGDTADFFERLHGAEFIVGVHHGDEVGVRQVVKQIAQMLRIDLSIAIGGEITDGDAPCG